MDTQVIIIGAGPAGAAVSIFLTKACIPHIIIEKDTFPRDKVCGDAIGGKTSLVLRTANPEWLKEIYLESNEYLPTYGSLFVAPNGKVLSIPFSANKNPGEKAAGFTSPRLIFDNFLFEKLFSPYTTIYQNSSLQNIEQLANGHITVRFRQGNEDYQITAPLIVGADGDKSLVRKKFIPSHSSKSYCVALRAYYTGVTHFHPENFIELYYLTEVLSGYFWIFPLPNGMANVGVGILSNTIRKKKINLRELMLNAIKNNPHIRHRFTNAKLVGRIQGWGLPMAMKREDVSGNNFLLTGDAANLVDPFTGEGIGTALYSGMLAANAIEKSLMQKKYDAAFLKENYDDILYNNIGAELKISAILQRIGRHPWLLKYIVNKAYKSPSLNKAISGMFTNPELRKQLTKPSFYAKVLFNR